VSTDPSIPRCPNGGKLSYDSRSDAARALAQLFRAGRGSEHRMNAYQCRACGKWHIGHEKRKHPKRGWRNR